MTNKPRILNEIKIKQKEIEKLVEELGMISESHDFRSNFYGEFYKGFFGRYKKDLVNIFKLQGDPSFFQILSLLDEELLKDVDDCFNDIKRWLEINKPIWHMEGDLRYNELSYMVTNKSVYYKNQFKEKHNKTPYQAMKKGLSDNENESFKYAVNMFNNIDIDEQDLKIKIEKQESYIDDLLRRHPELYYKGDLNATMYNSHHDKGKIVNTIYRNFYHFDKTAEILKEIKRKNKLFNKDSVIKAMDYNHMKYYYVALNLVVHELQKIGDLDLISVDTFDNIDEIIDYAASIAIVLHNHFFGEFKTTMLENLCEINNVNSNIIVKIKDLTIPINSEQDNQKMEKPKETVEQISLFPFR